MVVGAVVSDKRLWKEGNVFIVNLAFADLCVTGTFKEFFPTRARGEIARSCVQPFCQSGLFITKTRESRQMKDHSA